MFKRIDRLILKAFIGPFLATFVLSMFLFLMQFLWKYIDDLVGKGIEFTILVRLIIYSLADLVPMALPLTIMVAGLMTFGNLSESFELVALKGNGIGLKRALRPIFFLMCALAVVNFVFMNLVIPRANLEAKALLYDLRQKKPAFSITEGQFYEQIDNVAMRIGKKDQDNETIHDILIYEYRKDDSKRLNRIHAEKGTMKLSDDKRMLFLTLLNGTRYEEMTQAENYQKTMPFNVMQFEKQNLKIDLSSLDLKLTDRDAYKGDHRLMPIGDLNKEIDTSNMKVTKIRRESAEYLKRNFHYFGYISVGGQFAPNSNADGSERLTKTDILSNFDKNLHTSVMSMAISTSRNIKGIAEGLISNVKMEQDEIMPFRAERHKKFALSFIIVLLFLISAPLGAIIRKGGIGMPLVISVLLFVLFYALNLTGEKIGKEGIVPLWMGMWMSSLVLLPIGVLITYKATKDSSVISIEKYVKFFKRLLKPVAEFLNNTKPARKFKVHMHNRNK